MIVESYLFTCSRAALLAVPKRLLRRETPYPVALSPTCLTSWLVWFSQFWIQNGWNPVLNIDNPRQPWSKDDKGLRWTKWVLWSKEDLLRQFDRTTWSPDFKKDDKKILRTMDWRLGDAHHRRGGHVNMHPNPTPVKPKVGVDEQASAAV